MASISSSFRLSLLASEDANRSVNTTKNQILKSNISINKISRVISSNTKEKERLAFRSSILDARRIEASRRKEIEDRIEASKVSTNPTRGFRMIGSSSAGPFQRLLGFLGFLTAGWLVENLPTIIFIGKEFISRVFKVANLISDFIGDTLSIISNFGTLLTSIATNVATFDFTDQSDRVKNSFLDLNSSMQSVNDELFQAYKLLTTPLTQSSDTGEEAPPLGEEAPNTLYPQPSTSSGGGSPGGGGFGESGVSKGVEIARRLQKDLGLRDYQAAAVVGNLLQENSTLGPSVLEGGKKGLLTEAMRKGTGYGWAQWTYPSRQKELYQLAESMGVDPSKQPLTDEINYAMLVRELPRYDSGGRFRNSKNIEEASNWFLFQYENPADKGSREQSERIADSKKVLQGLSSTSSTPQTPTAPPRPVSTGTMNLIPQTGSGGFIQGGSGSGGESTYATHFHLDAKTANPSAAQLANIREVAFQAVKAMFARGSWIHFGNIKRDVNKNVSDSELKSLIASEQQAHGARSSMAVDIQEHNPKTKQTFPSQPGSATKFPFAVGSVYYRGGYGREAEIIGSQGITVSHGAAGSSGSDLSGKPVKANLYPTVKPNVEQVITPERKGQTILVDIPESSPPQQTTVVSPPTEGKKPTGQVDNTYLLNRFIKQKLLLDLAYL
jgi:hypothetical protein